MKWKSEPHIERGTKRISKYFAFTPVETTDGYTVWLQNYWAVEEYGGYNYGYDGFNVWAILSTSSVKI